MIRFELSPTALSGPPDQRVRLAHPSISTSIVNQRSFSSAAFRGSLVLYFVLSPQSTPRSNSLPLLDLRSHSRCGAVHRCTASTCVAVSSADSSNVIAPESTFKGDWQDSFEFSSSSRHPTGQHLRRPRRGRGGHLRQPHPGIPPATFEQPLPRIDRGKNAGAA